MMTIQKNAQSFSKAREYVRYCRDCEYTLKIYYDDDSNGYLIYTAGGTMCDFFEDWDSMICWLAQRYDDEKEAGNIE